jgi:hypothetical protein
VTYKESENSVNLLERFYPDEIQESAYVIPFADWYRKGYRGIIFDIDNTLVPHGADADTRSRKLFKELRELGFTTLLLSNNKEERVKRFNRDIGTTYIYKAGKPGAKNYRHAMELMGTTAETTLFVGDQLFTDVWGAKKAGIYSILVKPIDPREEIQIVLKRYLEKPVLYFYSRNKKKETGERHGEQHGD